MWLILSKSYHNGNIVQYIICWWVWKILFIQVRNIPTLKKTCDLNPTNVELSDGSTLSLFKMYNMCVCVWVYVCVLSNIQKIVYSIAILCCTIIAKFNTRTKVNCDTKLTQLNEIIPVSSNIMYIYYKIIYRSLTMFKDDSNLFILSYLDYEDT